MFLLENKGFFETNDLIGAGIEVLHWFNFNLKIKPKICIFNFQFCRNKNFNGNPETGSERVLFN